MARVSDEMYEEMHTRTVAADAAGHVTYPGTALRQLKPTTPEQRAALRERMRRNPEYVAWQAERTRPRWGRATVMIAALTLAMGALGWGLGGLGRTRALHAAAWWVLACATLLVLDGRVMFWVVDRTGVRLGRAPYWAPLALFTAAAIAAWLGTRHQAPTPGTPHAAPVTNP